MRNSNVTIDVQLQVVTSHASDSEDLKSMRSEVWMSKAKDWVQAQPKTLNLETSEEDRLRVHFVV